MKKTVFDFLGGLGPKPTPEEEAAARAQGLSVPAYRAAQIAAQVASARKAANERDGVPDDVAAESDKAMEMQRNAGLLKRRGVSPNILVQAAETPGEVARMVLFVFLYVAGLAVMMIIAGERVQKLPGIFQCGLLALLLIPVWWLTNRIWHGVGEGVRDFFRALVRFWPATLVLLVFALGILRVLKQHLLP